MDIQTYIKQSRGHHAKALEAVEKLLIDFSGKCSADPAGVWLNRPKAGWKPASWSYRSKS